MKLVKTIICSALAVLAAAGALTGCSDNKPNSSQVSYTEYVTPEDFSTTDEAKEKTTFKGTGKNSQLEVSASVYGKTYTLGKSTVEDMLGDGWQKSEDNWQKFPSDKKIPAHSVNIIAKNLYQGEGEDKRSLFISFRNITDKTCTTDKCALSKIEINGRYDTFLGETRPLRATITAHITNTASKSRTEAPTLSSAPTAIQASSEISALQSLWTLNTALKNNKTALKYNKNNTVNKSNKTLTKCRRFFVSNIFDNPKE